MEPCAGDEAVLYPYFIYVFFYTHNLNPSVSYKICVPWSNYCKNLNILQGYLIHFSD